MIKFLDIRNSKSWYQKLISWLIVYMCIYNIPHVSWEDFLGKHEHDAPSGGHAELADKSHRCNQICPSSVQLKFIIHCWREELLPTYMSNHTHCSRIYEYMVLMYFDLSIICLLGTTATIPQIAIQTPPRIWNPMIGPLLPKLQESVGIYHIVNIDSN